MRTINPVGYKTIVEVIASHGGVPIEDVKPESRLVDLGIDSLSAVDIIMGLRDRIGLEIDDDELSAFSRRVDFDPVSKAKQPGSISTIDDLVRYIVEHAQRTLRFPVLLKHGLLYTDNIESLNLQQTEDLALLSTIMQVAEVEREPIADASTEESDARLIAEGMRHDLETGDAIDDDDDV